MTLKEARQKASLLRKAIFGRSSIFTAGKNPQGIAADTSAFFSVNQTRHPTEPRVSRHGALFHHPVNGGCGKATASGLWLTAIGIAAVLFGITAPANAQIHERVLNGAPTTGGSEWVVSLQSADEFGTVLHFCGGSLIDPVTVLTAAHCVYDFVSTPDAITVVAGSARLSDTKAARVTAEGVIVYPGFDPGTLKNDIALVKLSEPVSVDQFVSILPQSDFVGKVGQDMRLYGWGLIYVDVPVRPDYLQQADFPLTSDDECSSRLGLDFDPGTMLCAGKLASSSTAEDGLDACNGDSGGPLVDLSSGSPRIAGIVSWGFGCGGSKTWGVYTKASLFKDWIESQPAIPPFSSGTVEVIGVPEVGGTLTCKAGTIGGAAPLKVTYNWVDQESGQIVKKSLQRIRLGARDLGRVLSCTVSAENPGGVSEFTSDATWPVLPKRSSAKNRRSRSADIEQTRSVCSSEGCVAVMGAGHSIKSARVIMTPRTGRSRVLEPMKGTSSSLIVKYARSFHGTITFRVVLDSGTWILRALKVP